MVKFVPGIPITVNQKEHRLREAMITYEDLVRIAFPARANELAPNYYNVTYMNNRARNPSQGTLSSGQGIPIADGAQFTVVQVDPSV